MELSKETIMYLKYLHGFFNLSVAGLVLYQYRLGASIRKIRLNNASAPQEMKKHLKLGPFAVALGILGFVAGNIIIFMDKARVLVYPVHFISGGLIAFGLVYLFILSRKMIAGDISNRSLHGKVAMVVVALYLMQILLGLGILL